MINFDFIKPEHRHIPLFKRCFDTYKSISCEFCAGSIFAWSGAENTEFYYSGSALFIRRALCGSYAYYPPVFAHDDSAFIDYIRRIRAFHKENYSSAFRLIHLSEKQRDIIMSALPGVFRASSDRNKSEYIYDADKLRTFQGKKLHSKKNHLNKFYALFGSRFSYESLDEQNAAECLDMSAEWSRANSYYLDDSLLGELEITGFFLRNFRFPGLLGGCLRIDGRIMGFTIGEVPYEGCDTVVIHAEKALYGIDGIYPALVSLFLQNNRSFKFENREDDLGDAGLRFSKLSYRPLFLLDKYTLVEKSAGEVIIP